MVVRVGRESMIFGAAANAEGGRYGCGTLNDVDGGSDYASWDLLGIGVETLRRCPCSRGLAVSAMERPFDGRRINATESQILDPLEQCLRHGLVPPQRRPQEQAGSF